MRRQHAPYLLILFSLVLVSCQPASLDKRGVEPAAEWTLLWSTSADFKSPESAAIDTQHDRIFVSNVNGYERNGKGFISTLKTDGSVENLRWLTGLNAPTGLAVSGDILWAVDYDQLLKISIPEQRVVARFATTDKDPLLNDVSVTKGGDIFVTGSNSNSVYMVADGKLRTWLKDDERLKFANGIYANDTDVVVAAFTLIKIDRKSKDIEILAEADLINDLEGVKPDGSGGYYVSMIGNRPVQRIGGANGAAALFSGTEYVADFDYQDGFFVAPTGAAEVSAYDIAR